MFYRPDENISTEDLVRGRYFVVFCIQYFKPLKFIPYCKWFIFNRIFSECWIVMENKCIRSYWPTTQFMLHNIIIQVFSLPVCSVWGTVTSCIKINRNLKCNIGLPYNSPPTACYSRFSRPHFAHCRSATRSRCRWRSGWSNLPCYPRHVTWRWMVTSDAVYPMRPWA